MSPLPAAAHRVAVDVVALAIADPDVAITDDEDQTLLGSSRPPALPSAPPSLVFVAVRRPREPYAGMDALPGSLVRTEEDLPEAASRVMTDVAGLNEPKHLEQLATFGAPQRDPRGRVLSVSYLALLPRPADLGEHARWIAVDEAPQLAFDHAEILASAVERLQGKLSYSNVAYGLLPDEFTLSELQAVYQTVLGREIDKRNFRKKVLGLGMVTETEGMRRGSHRPAQLYRFPRRSLVLLDDVITA